MQKVIIEFCYVVNGNEANIHLVPNFPIPDAKQVALLFIKELDQIEMAQLASQEAAPEPIAEEAQEEKVEVLEPEPMSLDG